VERRLSASPSSRCCCVDSDARERKPEDDENGTDLYEDETYFAFGAGGAFAHGRQLLRSARMMALGLHHACPEIPRIVAPPFLDWTDQPSQLTYLPGERIGAWRSSDAFDDSDSPTAFQERKYRELLPPLFWTDKSAEPIIPRRANRSPAIPDSFEDAGSPTVPEPGPPVSAGSCPKPYAWRKRRTIGSGGGNVGIKPVQRG
jgi:hypothetical protein